MKEVMARQPATELRAAILGHLASEARPELADMRIRPLISTRQCRNL
jgi:hypothetical protein